MSTAAKVLAAARKDLGYWASRPNGKSKFGIWYGDLPGVRDSGFDAAAFCAMAISYWANIAKATSIIPVHAYTPSGVNWFKARKQWHTGKTSGKVGDIAYMRFSGSRVHHVGIVEKVLGGGRYQLIEANTSGTAGGDQRNGGVVARKTRTVASAGIQGFGRPAYGSTDARSWLQRGDTGTAVKDLQTALAAAGYDLGPAGADGDFGPATEKAVTAFQKAAKITVDGLAGKDTLAALTATSAPAKPAKPKALAFWVGLANVTGITYSDGVYLGGGWPKRGPKVAARIAGLACSLYAVNEVTATAMTRTISAALAAKFRHTGSRRGNDVWFDGSKFELLQEREFHVPGIKQNRSVKWAELRRDGKVFNLLVPHFPNGSPEQRTVMARHIVDLVKDWRDPIILAGDINNTSKGEDAPRAIFAAAGLIESRQQASTVVGGDVAEFPGGKPGAWLSDVFTRGCTVTDMRLVEVPRTESTHHFFQARIEIGA